ncbi:MAG: hypothetical protein HY290_06185 [Planctomycetia bacterium]|nr:hypothetical protein [Planctomycetia bacterium]
MPSIGSIARFIADQFPFTKKRKKSPTNHTIRDEFTANLGVMRLEARRVLNAAAVPVGPPPTPPPDAAANAAAAAQSQQQSVILTVDASQQAQQHGGDIFVVKRNGENVDVTINGSPSVSKPLSAVGQLIINGSDGNDKLVIDYSGGNPLSGGGIQFNGGKELNPGGDQIVIEGGPAGAVTYTLDSANSGVITIDSMSISFSGVESVSDTLSASSRAIYVAAGGGSLTLGDGRAAGMGEVTTSSGMVLDFADPTSSLTVDTALSGSASFETITVSTFHDAFGANLFFHGDTGDTLNISGAVDLGAASLTGSAGTILISGSITSAGGAIDLAGSQAVTIAATANIQSVGGFVTADAGAAGTLVDYGVIDVSNIAAGATGGSVQLLGKYVGLAGDARVDASGNAGGGTILVGGDMHGANPLVHNAARTYVGQNVTLSADALHQGNGGKIIVWSDDVTRYFGSISARGGALDGDGGFVEVSSGHNLDYNGRVDLGAAHGITGLLLLDPDAIVITHGADGSGIDDAEVDVDGTINFADGAGTFTISDGAILAAGSSILLEANVSIGTVGAVDLTLTGANTLSLTTKNNLALGVIDLTSAVAFGTSGGKITISASTSKLAPGLIAIGAMDSAGGDIEITTGFGSITLTGALTAGAGAVTLTAAGGIGETATGTISTTGTLTVSNTLGGDVTLDQANVVTKFDASNTAASGTVIFNDTAVALTVGSATGISTSGGDITVASAGTLALNKAVTTGAADTGTVRLQADGNITQAAIGIITAGTLGVYDTAGDITLDQANVVGTALTTGIFAAQDTKTRQSAATSRSRIRRPAP